MSNKRTALLIVICLLVGIAAGLGAKAMADRTKDESEMPLKKLSVTLAVGQRNAFFEQFRKFADKHGFAIRIAPVRPDGEHFIIEMWRSDFKVLGVNPENPDTFKVGIYSNDLEVPRTQLDELATDLKAHIGSGQGVTVVEK